MNVEALAVALRAYAIKQAVDLPMTFWRGMAEAVDLVATREEEE